MRLTVFLNTGVSLLLLTSCASTGPLVSNQGYVLDTTSDEVASLKSLKEMNVVMQQLDYSCGAASLATLMRHYFNQNIDEQTVLDTVENLFTKSEYAVIADKGLSFLELEKVSNELGFQSASVRLTTEALRKIQGPVLVYLETSEYKHFAVFRGFYDNRAYLADPSRGNVRLSMSLFLDEWDGKALVLGKPGFGVPLDHNLKIIDAKPIDNPAISRQQRQRLAPSQKELLGGSSVI